MAFTLFGCRAPTIIGQAPTTATPASAKCCPSLPYSIRSCSSIGQALTTQAISPASAWYRAPHKIQQAENKTMKKAIFYGVGLTTAFYLTLECTTYIAFGNNAPGNILTGFSFYEPFWLVDIANICIIVHLLGACQVVLRFRKHISSSKISLRSIRCWG